MNTDGINNVESAESERLLSGNTVQAHIYGSKDPVCLYWNGTQILDFLGFSIYFGLRCEIWRTIVQT